MTEDERIRVAARPHGIVSEACRKCAFFSPCGGIEPEGSLFDCFHHYCCGNKEGCDEVCPYNSNFFSRMAEVGGFRFDRVSTLEQPSVELPRYVPLIHHGYSHRMIDVPVAALDTYQVFRLRNKQYRAIADDGVQLRQNFGLPSTTKIILRGTARDPLLEQYWAFRRRDGVAEKIGSLGVMLVIAPNFSHFLNVPRPDNLFNRMRHLICVTELAKAGVCVVPHLSATQPGDWRFWQSYLRQNKTVFLVAAEFQTGNKNPAEGRRVIEKIAAIQDALKRRLHPIAIGGTQFVRELAARFDTFTLIDSSPFMKAIKRRRINSTEYRKSWRDTFTLNGQGVDEIILENLKGHSAWIEEQQSQARAKADTPDVQSINWHSNAQKMASEV